MGDEALRAADAMITEMRVGAADITVAELHAQFAAERFRAALLVDGGFLVAVVVRDDLSGADGAQLAAPLGRLGSRVVAPDAELEATRQRLLQAGQRRLAVADADGHLVGLLCLKRSGTGFCTHEDLESRRRERFDRPVT